MAFGGNSNKKKKSASMETDENIVVFGAAARQYDEEALLGLKKLARATTESAIQLDASCVDYDNECKHEKKQKQKNGKSNKVSLEELIIEYENTIESEYIYGVFLKSTNLFNIKSKISYFLDDLRKSKKISEANDIIDVEYNIFSANKTLCNSGIVALKYISENTKNKGSQQNVNAKLKVAINHYEKANEEATRKNLSKSIKEYENSYKEILKGFEKAGYKLDEEFFDSNIDTDQDTLNDGFELLIGTNPFNKDTDNDGIQDNLELEMFPYFDPTKADIE